MKLISLYINEIGFAGLAHSQALSTSTHAYPPLTGFDEDSSSNDSVDLQQAVAANDFSLPIREIENKLLEKVNLSELEHEVELQIKGKSFVDEAVFDAKFEVWRIKIAMDLERNQTGITVDDLAIVQIEISNLRQTLLNIENDLHATNTSQQPQQQLQPSHTQAPDIVPSSLPIQNSSAVNFDYDFDEPIVGNGNHLDNDLFNRLNDKMRHLSKKIKKVEKSFTSGMAQSMEQVIYTINFVSTLFIHML